MTFSKDFDNLHFQNAILVIVEHSKGIRAGMVDSREYSAALVYSSVLLEKTADSLMKKLLQLECEKIRLIMQWLLCVFNQLLVIFEKNQT